MGGKQAFSLEDKYSIYYNMDMGAAPNTPFINAIVWLMDVLRASGYPAEMGNLFCNYYPKSKYRTVSFYIQGGLGYSSTRVNLVKNTGRITINAHIVGDRDGHIWGMIRSLQKSMEKIMDMWDGNEEDKIDLRPYAIGSLKIKEGFVSPL